jgi:hypothetical protein
MFEVQYRCQHREHWYDDLETDVWAEAVQRARTVVAARRGLPVRICLTRALPGRYAVGAIVWMWNGQHVVE